MNNKCFLLPALAAAALLMASCSNEDAEDVRTVDMMPKTTFVELNDEQMDMVQTNNDFSFNLLRAVAGQMQGQSFAMSPLSVIYNLGMINDGASGETQAEIVKALGLNKQGVQELNELCQKLIVGLPKADPNVTFLSANAIYVNKGYTLTDGFKADMSKYYQADAKTLDFGLPSSRTAINSWASKHTGGLIGNLIGQLDADAAAYLLSAVYFNATWTLQFDRANTRTEDFTLADGSTTRVPMMHNKAQIVGYGADDYNAVLLPYGSGGIWNMFVLLPDEGKTVADVLNSLSSASWRALFKRAESYELDLKLPKFSTTTSGLDLIPGMKRLGVSRMFGNNAELGGICKEKDLFLKNMFHTSMIDVTEEGTKATAVTVSEMQDTSAGPWKGKVGEFHANRPFVYLITDAYTGVIALAGIYSGK